VAGLGLSGQTVHRVRTHQRGPFRGDSSSEG
jgi:hypothetical protein